MKWKVMVTVYYSIAHQTGKVSQSSKDDELVSHQLNVVQSMMSE